MSESSQTARARWMALIAQAPPERVRLWDAAGLAPEFDWLRPPETGMAMVRGRAGGTGAPFNLGEMTVTRCALRLESGTDGHAYVPGRDRGHAEIAALCDALMQDEAIRARVAEAILAPLEADRAARHGTAGGPRGGDAGGFLHPDAGGGLMQASALAGGFGDPARDAAAAFRVALDCMARPGRIGRLTGAAGPAGLSGAAAVLLLTLADADTPVWLPERLRTAPAADWVRFHTNAPMIAAPAAALFAPRHLERARPARPLAGGRGGRSRPGCHADPGGGGARAGRRAMAPRRAGDRRAMSASRPICRRRSTRRCDGMPGATRWVSICF